MSKPNLNLVRTLVIAGRFADVIAPARAGIAALQPALAKDPANPDNAIELHQLRNFLGAAQLTTTDYPAALETYNQDRASLEAVLAAHPGDGDWRTALVTTLLRISSAQSMSHHPQDQWAALQTAVAVAAPLIPLPDRKSEWSRTLIDLEQKLASAESTRHNNVAAIDHYKQALAIADDEFAKHPKDRRARTDRVIALALVAAGYRANGQITEADDYAARSNAAKEKPSVTN